MPLKLDNVQENERGNCAFGCWIAQMQFHVGAVIEAACVVAVPPYWIIVPRAIRIAKAHRTVTCITIPADLQEEKASNNPTFAWH